MKSFFADFSTGLGVVAIMAVLTLGGIAYEKYVTIPNRKSENPRLKNGQDVIITSDSVYYIHFAIDSVEEKESPPEDGQ